MQFIQTTFLVSFITIFTSCGSQKEVTTLDGGASFKDSSSTRDLGNEDSSKTTNADLGDEGKHVDDMKTSVDMKDMPSTSTCVVTLCLTGATKPDESSNAAFEDLCDRVGIVEGVVPYCRDANSCFSSWNNFDLTGGPNIEKDIFPKLLEKLDTNKDGKVSTLDEACDLHLVGYSWGGINSAKMADLILASDLFEGPRKKVKKLVAIDPFQRGIFTGPPETFAIPSNVEHFWTFRHSQKNASDCSSGAPGGPYFGIDPTCSNESTCLDYDFSGDEQLYSWPDTANSSSGSAKGKDLGHCTILKASANAAFSVLTGLALPEPLPTPQKVPGSK